MNNDADVTITLGCSAFNKKRIGLKNIPPPIPTIPETRPKTEPIKKDIKLFNFFIFRFSLFMIYYLLTIINLQQELKIVKFQNFFSNIYRTTNKS